ncbi:peptidase domain-containing ABC transporter [Oligoflexus tunisiensis]|uniref:peptidase domain-containing ABC transporter n=1 Tax=Oligoflexus tunisiensis TaxID=708132 RepID=UPI000AE9F682|nr:peptidase domain-containing ABC transporter [Oligoflexus tunisiensis]
MEWTDVDKIFKRRSLQPMLQTEVTECGLVCIAMIANYHGHDIDLSALRLRFPVSSRGLHLGHLIDIAADLKLDSRPVRVELDDMNSLELPCILHWDMNHFVVCEKVTTKSVTILDPIVGRRRLAWKEVSKSFTGVALELSPHADFKPVVYTQKIRLSQFWSNLVGIEKSVGLLLAVCCALLALTLLSPYLSMFVIDEVVTSHDLSLLNLLCISFGFVAVFYAVANLLRDYIVLYIGSQFAVQMSRNLVRHLIYLPLTYFEKRHVGDIMSRLGSLDFVKRILTEEIVSVLIDGVIMSLAFILMLAYSPRLSLLVLATLAIYAVLRTIAYRAYRQASEEVLLAQGMENSNLLETIRGIQAIKLYGGERSRITVWMQLYMKVMNASVRASKAKIWGTAANRLLFGLENLLVIYLGARSVLDRDLTIGVFVAFLSYKTQFTERMASLIEKFLDFRLLSLHLERMGDIVLQNQELMQPNPTRISLEGSLSARFLSYRYSPQEPYLFENLSVDIRSGESVAITGPSGSGKTTLVKILLGLLDPEKGEVLVDGHDIRKVTVEYRSQVATVMQDDRLLTGSVAENIAFFDPEPSMERIQQCGMIACIHDEIMAMTMGYYSLVSDMGSDLSGGQKQRILLARALYRQPRILFLDEATSNLDVDLERAINNAIKELKITRIIIAHRPETIASAERVLRLSDNKLLEERAGQLWLEVR